MPCNQCTKDLPIVNVKYGLCHSCNSVRLTGKTPAQRQAESVTKYRQKAANTATTKTSGTHTPIKQQTAKESAVKKQLSELKKEIRLEAIQNNEYYCCGCGQTGLLDCSHILPVGMFKHLELVKKNIQLLCRDCHRVWESSEIDQKMRLYCFVENMLFIKEHDLTTYNKNITKIESYLPFIEYRSELLFVRNILENLEK